MFPLPLSFKKAKYVLQKVEEVCTNLYIWTFSKCVMTTEPLK